MAKKELRRRMREELARLSTTARAAASESIRTTIPSLPRWQDARVVAAYVALPDEPDLQPFSWLPDRALLLPRMQGDRLVFHRIDTADQLIPGPFGVLEPDADKCPPSDPADADIIFVPGLAFTPHGTRLGRGRGFYDRALAGLPASVFRIGICFPGQILDTIPHESHDESVDLVLSSQA